MTNSDQLFQPVCEEITAGMQRIPIPGLAVGVWHAGNEQVAGFGVTSLENPLPVTPDTLFQVGSISKTFTATALMMLMEAGKVDLDTPVRAYLPDFQLSDESVAARVTLRHLLTHTGGWLGDYFNDFGFGDDAQAKMLTEIAQAAAVHAVGRSVVVLQHRLQHRGPHHRGGHGPELRSRYQRTDSRSAGHDT